MFFVSNAALLGKLITQFPLIEKLGGIALPVEVEIVKTLDQQKSDCLRWWSDDRNSDFYRNEWNTVVVATPERACVLSPEEGVEDILMDTSDFVGPVAILKEYHNMFQNGTPSSRSLVIVKEFDSRAYREAELAKVDFASSGE